jgi:CDP-paratose 2-epimerase
MKTALITGIGGLVGSETAIAFHKAGYKIVGIENDTRSALFGPAASTSENLRRIQNLLPNAVFFDCDIRHRQNVLAIYEEYGKSLSAVIHTAAQPSHDLAAKIPFDDFEINASGTLNLLEAHRHHAPETPFLFTSTNKVYGDRPNSLPREEKETRYEIPKGHLYENGVDESMSIDSCTHSLFGVSKCAADLLVQEYGRYFHIPTACFRGGCLTGPAHAGTQLHGFLSYLAKCAVQNLPYTIFGYNGKQVRDNIHSEDLANAFLTFTLSPKVSAVYNIGGGRHSNCSMLEAIQICEEFTGRPMQTTYDPNPRIGDHQWWISNTQKFENDYPTWKQNHTLKSTLHAILQTQQQAIGE